MKFAILVLIFFALILFPDILCARKIGGLNSHHGHHYSHHHHHHRSKATRANNKGATLMKLNANNFFNERRTSGLPQQGEPETEELAGSRLPDCSHACGSCSPCRLVMVSFVCASIEEAESCPMAYKCMCRHKTYPVP